MAIKALWTTAFMLNMVLGTALAENIDVVHGDQVLLKCRFSPIPSSSSVTLYWIRTNMEGSDNAAIQDTALDSDYTVERFPSLGSYDLHITNTTHKRDNAEFKCMLKEAGTGKLLHTNKIGITVLIKPSPPIITPRTPIATEGLHVNITCTSSGGSPPPEVSWFREGMSDELEATVLQEGSNMDLSTSILSILPAKEDDGAIFRCTVWNRAMGQRQKLEATTRLHVKYFPRVTTGLNNPLLVEEGDTAAMLCEVDSNPSVNSVKWTRAGRYIATTFRHVIPTVDIEDEGPYYCEADNNLGQTGKSELNISVLYGPRVTVEKFKEVDQGGNTRIECQATANPEPVSYEWTKYGDATFKTSGKFLKLKKVSHTDSGEYICTVNNVLNPTLGVKNERRGNSSVKISVRHKPGVGFIEPREPESVEGKSITLICGASPSGYPDPQFKWWKGDRPSEILGTTSNLTIGPVHLSSAGEYTCQSDNKIGKGTPASARLRVMQEPKIVSHLPAQMVRRAGETGVKMSCQGQGKPRPEVNWLLDGTKIDKSQSYLYEIKENILSNKNSETVQVLSTLSFKGKGRMAHEEVLPGDGGKYSCQFVNSVGRAQSEVTLKVEHSPIVSESEKESKVAADVGETADISCRMKAFPAPKFEWSRDRVPISSLGRIMWQNDKQLTEMEYESRFTIKSVKQNSYGEYTCKASNSMGVGMTIVKLVKKGKPESPSNLKALTTEANTISVTWKENFHGGLKNISFRLQYRPQGSTILHAKELLCLHNPCTLSDLVQHSTYLVRAKAVNDLGESNWSDYVSLTTLIDAAQIPSVTSLIYDNSTNAVSFKVSNYPLNLKARIEVLILNNSWQLIRSVSLKNKPYEFALPRELSFETVRVKLCLETDDTLCGTYGEGASLVDRIAIPQLSANDDQDWMVAVVIGALVTLLISLLVLVKCCWQSKSSADKLYKTGNEMMLARPDILHPIDDKTINQSKRCSHHKSGLYAYNSTSQNSKQGTDSHDNSQDSLWWSKEEFGHQIAPNNCECNQYPRHDMLNSTQCVGVKDAYSLPHLGSLEQGAGGQYGQFKSYSGQELYGTHRKVIREIIV